MHGAVDTAPPREDLALRIAHWCSIVYISIYALESPIRYGLHLIHLGPGIVLRDGLIVGPLLLIGARGALRRELHPAFWVFGLSVGVGSIVSVLNFGTPMPALVATKILLTVLFGVIAGRVLVLPGKQLARYMFALWVITVIALVAEKYAVSFPWVGMKETIGGVDVEIARDWQIGDPGSKRVGGFTRSSISAAVLVCALCLVIIFQLRHYLLRLGVIAVTVGAVYLTTQKGAAIGFVLVAMTTCAPRNWLRPLLALLLIAAVLCDIGLPLYTNGLFMEQGSGGVFSGASFAGRIVDTWPKSLAWIEHHQMFPFGTGVGGIGASQKMLDNESQHYPDNVFLLLYSYFGLFCILFFGLFVQVALRSPRIDQKIAEPGLAIATFMLLYGIVVSVIEDQASSLYMAAGLGVLLSAPLLPYRSASAAAGKWQRPPPPQAHPATRP